MPSHAPTRRLWAMAVGGWVAAALHTAAVLGIADLLPAGPRSAEDLAAAMRTPPDALRRLLRMLAAHGVFAERDDGHFAQTELSTLLQADAAGSLRSMLLMDGTEVWRAPWGLMLHSIRMSETSFSKAHGAELFEYMTGDSEFAATFNQAMTEGSQRLAGEIVSAYDFSRFGTIVA